MKKIKRLTAVMLSLIMILTAFPLFAFAASEEDVSDDLQTEAVSPEYEAGELIVLVESKIDKSSIREMAGAAGGTLVRVSPLGDGTQAAIIKVDEGSEMQAVNILSARNDILFVQPNYKYELTEAYPDDPEYVNGSQVYLSADPKLDKNNAGSINAAGAWKQLGNSSLPDEDKILVGVIDTGARRDHVDLQGCVLKDECVTFNGGMKKDFRDGDNSDDDIGHGSCVTGIIGADINNGIYGAGVAGGRVKIIVVDAGNVKKGIDSIDIAMGIYYLTDKGVRIINMSVGGRSRDYLYERAVKYAWDKGTICICSAGNDGSSHMNSPGDSPFAVAVMAHEWDGTPSSFSSYGVERDISAPGSMLFTTGHLRKTSFETFDGTSAAAPVATGAAALLLSADPGLTPREIKNLLYTSSGKGSFSAKKSGQGFGRINLDTAMKNLLSEKTSPDKIVINKTDIKMYEGADTAIEYAVYPGNTNSVTASFESSNTKVASVDKDGIIKAKAPGEATIKVSCKGVTASCKVTVREVPYKTIDRKPYRTSGRITLDELMDSVLDEKDKNDQLQDENGFYYHLYKIKLKEGEKITVFMTSRDSQAYLRIKDKKGNIVANGDLDSDERYSEIVFTAKKAGTYQIQAFQVHQGGKKITTSYDFMVASNKAKCLPEVVSTDYGQIRLSWPAVKDAFCYRLRKYSDKKKTKIVREEYVNTPKYTDTSYDSNKVQYYTVTALFQTEIGNIYNGESSLLAVKPVVSSGRSAFSKLKLRSLKQTGNSITLKWSKLSKAKKYVIYASSCDTTAKAKKLATVKNDTKVIRKVAGKKLSKGTYYKFFVVAFDKNGNILSTSKTVHVATKGGKVGNHKSITIRKSVISKAKKLRKGETLKLNAKAIAQSQKLKVKQHVRIRYESTNTKIAAVSKSGKITAKKKGSCYIYAYAQNGAFRKIRVVVK